MKRLLLKTFLFLVNDIYSFGVVYYIVSNSLSFIYVAHYFRVLLLSNTKIGERFI